MLSPLYVIFLLTASIATILLLSAKYRFNTFFVLLIVAILVGFAAGMDGEKIVKALKTGFGATLEKIGLLIILGTALGVLLDKTKATHSLAHFILQKTGVNQAPLAVTIMGFVIGLPIFCDSGFIVLIGLVLSLVGKLQKQHVLLVICLATSLYAVHCLVPPHPGITAAAGVLKADLGKSMLLGTLLAIPPTIVAFVWVKIQTKNLPHTTLPTVESLGLDTETLPNPWASFLPIIVPILLIALKSIFLLQPAAYPPVVLTFIKTLGEPIVALLVGIMLTMRLCKPLNSWVINAFWESAIEKSGPILAIIAMGGAFGEIIKNMDIGKVLGSSLGGSNLGLWIPFLLTAVFKTAQGSSTVAIISTAAIVEPLLSALGLDSETGRLLALMAMGAGSMAISHVNDAYFWVISKFGIVDTQNTLKIYSTASIWMSITTFLFVWLASFIL